MYRRSIYFENMPLTYIIVFHYPNLLPLSSRDIKNWKETVIQYYETVYSKDSNLYITFGGYLKFPNSNVS